MYTKSLLLYSSITKALGKKGYYLPNAVANLCLPKVSHMYAVALGPGQTGNCHRRRVNFRLRSPWQNKIIIIKYVSHRLHRCVGRRPTLVGMGPGWRRLGQDRAGSGQGGGSGGSQADMPAVVAKAGPGR